MDGIEDIIELPSESILLPQIPRKTQRIKSEDGNLFLI